MLLNKLFNGDNKIQDIDGIKITKKQIDTLKWYKIDYNVKDYKILMDNIYNEQFMHVDDEGLPSDEHYYILQDMYDEIEKQNK